MSARRARGQAGAAVLTAALALSALSACDGASKATPSGSATAKVATAPGSATASTAQPASLDVRDASPAKAQAAPAPPRLPERANVLLISIDSLRADMPWAGYPRDIAPNLAALEKKSVSFTHAYALSSYTSMSLGGLLAGRYPSELKRDGFFFGTYPKENLFFPELLQAAKIRTVSAHAHGYFKDAGFQQGFDAWELVPNLKWNNTTDENVTGEPHEKLAEKLLGTADRASPRVAEGDAGGGGGGDAGAVSANDGRFFAWFHFLDPHDMYMDHEADGIPSFGKTARDKYDGEVLYTDQKLGKLLAFVDKAPWRDRTIIIVTADHGEAFGEHKQFMHGFELWENLVHVPLFVYVPGLAPRHVETEVSAIDLAPTILDVFGLSKDPAMEGRTLVPSLLSGQEPEARDVVVDLPETSDNDRRRALVFDKKKVISFGADAALQVFDLEADPKEEHPLTSGEAYTQMVKRYRAASGAIKEVAPYACGKSCLNRAYLNQGTK